MGAKRPDLREPQDMDSSFASAITPLERKPMPATALWGLANRKQRWSLSWKGWVVFLLTSLGAALLFLLKIYPFLAVTDRIETNTMVVEGWLDPTDLALVVDEFKQNRYQRVFTTGGPVHGMPRYVNDYSTAAHIAAQRLIELGLPVNVIQSVPSHVRERDRTYGSAVALRDWIRDHNLTIPSFVLVTQGAHARRSRLLFREAFDDGTKIGIVAIKNPDYDGAHWWRYSEGVKEIISEGAAYAYARFLFFPDRNSASDAQPQLAPPSPNHN